MLVSAIMPTSYSRRNFIERAVKCFLDQTWPDKELIIIDDGESVEDLIPKHESIRYFRSDEKKILGQKRNDACWLARGEVICHFDDDDWSSPDRISDQVQRLESTGKAVTGYHAILFYEEQRGEVYRFDAVPQRYVMGTSLCYRRSWWINHQFPQIQVGEDSQFILPALRGKDKQLVSSDGTKLIVARVHDNHTSPKDVTNRQYTKVDLTELPEGFIA